MEAMYSQSLFKSYHLIAEVSGALHYLLIIRRDLLILDPECLPTSVIQYDRGINWLS